MQKADHAGEAGTWFLIDQLNPLGARTFEFLGDVVSLEAQVMQSAAPAREELADAIVGIERFQQFDSLSPAISSAARTP